jgi:flagellar FliL protein
MADEANQVEVPNQGGGMMGKLIAGGVIGLIVMVETVVAFMMTPDPEAIAEKVRAEVAASVGEDVEDSDLLDEVEMGPVSEIELGTFDVAIHDPASDATYHVNCKVAATVAEKDAAEFDELLAKNENRLRERIMIEFRSASASDLNEAGLGLIKRRILEKSNVLLGKPLVKKIIFPEYNYYVQ